MTTKRFSAAEAEDIAKGWANSGMPQGEYARVHGVSARTLREWLQRYLPAPTPEAARAVIVDAIERLQTMLHALDEAQAARQPAATASTPASTASTVINVDSMTGNQTAARHADEQSPRQAENQTVVQEPTPEIKLRRHKFFGFLLDGNSKPLPEPNEKSAVQPLSVEK